MTEQNKKIIGKIIKDARKNKDMTQNDVANYAGITRNYVSDVENGRYMPSAETLLVLAKCLGIDLNLISKTIEIDVQK